MARPATPTTTDPTATDPALLSPGRVLASFDLADELIALLRGYLEDLVATLPALVVRHGFYGGAWRIGAHLEGIGPSLSARDTEQSEATDEPAARTHRPSVSRIDFELRVDSGRRRVDLTARGTIRGRDRRAERFATRLDESGREALREWIEAELLEFADRFTGDRDDEPTAANA